MYAVRHVREKRVDLLVRAFAVARVELPELRLEVYGDGPEHGRIARVVDGARVGNAVRLAGKRPEAEVDAAMARAAGVATASEREGYGWSRRGGGARNAERHRGRADNAAVELVEDGVNGLLAPAPPGEPRGGARGRGRAGPSLRESTSRWFEANASRLRIEASLELVAAAYRKVGRAGDRSAR